MDVFSDKMTSMSMVVMRGADGKSTEYSNNAEVVESGPMFETRPWGNVTQDEFFASLPVYDMFPLADWQSNTLLSWYALFYAILFIIGVFGNVSVITLIRHVHSGVNYDNTMIYVLFLCCVDLISILPLPMAVVDQLLGFWMFGTVLCKIYRFAEHVGRALSTFILAAMAFDRYLRVCFPCKKISRRCVIYQLICLSFLTFLLLLPLLIRSYSEEIILKEVLLEHPYRLARVRIFKCMDNLEGTKLAIFLTYMFLIGFAIPVMLIIIFYALMVKRLISRSRNISNSLPVARVTGYTIAISAFFIICWSPYWSSMLYLNISNSNSDGESENFVYIMYGIHLLSYGNSALNFLLYGLLNSQLMRRANQTTKKFAATTNSMTLKRENSRAQTLTTTVPLCLKSQTGSPPSVWDGNSSDHRIHDALL